MLFAVLPLLAAAMTCHAGILEVPGEYPSIQAAIESARPDDTVLVSPGTYPERVQMKARITLRSAGDDAKGELGLRRAELAIIDGGGVDGSAAGVTMAEGAVIDGFTVQNFGVFEDAVWQEHFDTHGENQDDEHIGQPGVAGISANGVTCQIRNNIVRRIGYSGIAAIGHPEKRVAPLVEKNYCYRNMGGGISAMRGSAATLQGNVCFENLYAGIGHDSSSPLVVGNECFRNVRAGIGISEGSSPVLRGNRCYRNQRAGIGIRGGNTTRPIVEDNDCYDNQYAGVGVRERAAPIIRGNRCYRNRRAGIGARTGATPIIVGNECYENDAAGIGQMSGTRTVIIGNYLHHNHTSGIGFDDGGKEGESYVVDNRVIDNATVAVGVQSGWKVTLTRNEMTREGGLPPIVMVFHGATVTLLQNVIRGGGVAGIRTAGNVIAKDNHFDGTSFRMVGPPNFAIWGLRGSDITMNGNRVNGWRHALSSSEGQVTALRNTVHEPGRAAFVITNPITSPVVIDNILVSSNSSDVVAILNGMPLSVDQNQISDAPSDPESMPNQH